MQKITILAGLVLALSCGIAKAELKVFACEPEWAALTEEIGGDHVDVFTATTALQDVHHIQPRPSLIARFRQADLAVCTGADLEIGWLPVLQNTAGNPAMRPGGDGLFFASEGLKMIEVPTRLDRAEGDVHPQGNPHVHMDPRNLIPISQRLTQRMAKLAPEHASLFRQRQKDFAKRWLSQITIWEAKAAPLRGVKVIAHHKTFSYLLNWLGMKELNNLEPKPGIPPSAAYLNGLLMKLKSDPASMILVASYQNQRPAEWLSERTDYPIVELPASVNGIANSATLEAMFSRIIERLLEAAT
ncbi:MAG: zinc ABC transporter substrate-binding protein [Salinisphaeraceae bacterium]|nr:zinc ABC transporter substrate-binding protein [Salinisphaeraceae bacterium]